MSRIQHYPLIIPKLSTIWLNIGNLRQQPKPLLCLHVTQKLWNCHYFLLFVYFIIFLEGLAKVIFKFFSNCCIQHVWPGLELLKWYAVCFQAMSFRDKQYWWIEVRASEILFFGTWNLHYHNDYGHQTCQGGDLPWGSPTPKILWPFDHVVLRDQVTN